MAMVDFEIIKKLTTANFKKDFYRAVGGGNECHPESHQGDSGDYNQQDFKFRHRRQKLFGRNSHSKQMDIALDAASSSTNNIQVRLFREIILVVSSMKHRPSTWGEIKITRNEIPNYNRVK